ncbi:MAG TPA: hypothetical protein DCZ12_07340 [Gammaproteobacteria bacterium]|nr:hypothetical protein [Gammaproteobacteria bacterium]
MKPFWFCVWLACGWLASCSYARPPLPEDQPYAGEIDFIRDRELPEISGMAPSFYLADHYWMLNDSGRLPRVFLVSARGKIIARVDVEGVKNTDWEDLARFTHGGKSYLLIADVGDNLAQRSSVNLHWVEEPNMAHGASADVLVVKPVRSIRLRYEEGPRDVESVAVDEAAGWIYLLSKRDQPPRFYRLPLASTSSGTVVATFVTELNKHPQPTVEEVMAEPRLGPFRYSPTAMDLSPDGRQLAVLGYNQVFLYSRNPDENWQEAFARSPEVLIRHQLRQAEAASYSSDGKKIIFTSEKLPAPILSVPLLKAASSD